MRVFELFQTIAAKTTKKPGALDISTSDENAADDIDFLNLFKDVKDDSPPNSKKNTDGSKIDSNVTRKLNFWINWSVNVDLYYRRIKRWRKRFQPRRSRIQPRIGRPINQNHRKREKLAKAKFFRKMLTLQRNHRKIHVMLLFWPTKPRTLQNRM